jgi:hypothetical protein
MRYAVAVTAILAAITAVALTGGGDPGVANLWVDTNGGTCTRQSPAGAYSDAGACSTPAAAITAAQVGDRINIKAGSYTSISCTKAVEIHPAPTESVSLTNAISITMPLTSGGCKVDGGDTLGVDETNRITSGNVEFDGTTPTDSGDPTTDRIVEDVKLNENRGVGFAGNHAVFRYSEVGPNAPCTGKVDLIFAGRPGTIGQPDVLLNVQIVGNYLHDHDADFSACPGEHPDLMDIQLGQSLIAYNVMDSGCATQCIFNSSDSQQQADQMHNLDIIGNYIDESSTIAVQCTGECELKYNTWGPDIPPGYAYRAGIAEAADMTVVGNVFVDESPTCGFEAVPESTVVEEYNVYPLSMAGDMCGTNGFAGAVTITGQESALAGRVSAGSVASVSGKGDPADCPPSIDLDGDARPTPGGTTCDAGADEVN